jgi:hypothetical protein
VGAPPLPRVLERAASKAASSTSFEPPGFAPQLRGSIFLTNSANQDECLRRRLFGLPGGQAKLLHQIDAARDRTLLFLFNFQKRKLLGAFIASGPAGFPLEPSAWQRGEKGPSCWRATAHSPGLL